MSSEQSSSLTTDNSQLTTPIWDDDERAAWLVPPKIRPSVWTEQNRIIESTKSSRPGPWRNENQPVLGPLMDLLDCPGINEVWIEKAVQMGGTEFVRNYMAYCAMNDPCSWLYVFPNEKDGRKQIKKYIRPIFNGRELPAIKRLVSPKRENATQSNIWLLNGTDIQLGWAGSATSLAGEPRKRVVLDEVNKFAPMKGEEADAVALGIARTGTYTGEHLIVGISTPTHGKGEITVRRQKASIQLRFYLPCPKCGAFQSMTWEQVKAPENVDKLDRDEWGNKIDAEVLARYECSHCQALWNDEERIAQLKKGFWGTGSDDESWKWWVDGRVTGTKPSGKTVGIMLHGLLDIMKSMSHKLAKWIRAAGNQQDLKDVKNNELGEPYIWDAQPITEDLFSVKCRPNPETGFVPGKEKLVPAWASRLLMAVDMQIDRFYVVVRAYGAQLRSRRIWHGEVRSFSDLEVLESMWWQSVDPTMPQWRIFKIGIDTGGGMARENSDATRTEEAYKWCRANPEKRIALKGSTRSLESHFRIKKNLYTPRKGGKPIEVMLHFVDPLYWRDLLAGDIRAKLPVVDQTSGEVLPGEIDLWELNDRNDANYNRHLSALIRQVVSRKGKKRQEEAWVPIGEGRRHDFHDCETYLTYMAHGPGMCFGLADEKTIREQWARAQAPVKPQQQSTGISMPDGRSFFVNKRK